MYRHNVVLQAQLDRRIAQVDELQRQVAQARVDVLARDAEIAGLKVRQRWRAQVVEVLVLVFGMCVGFFGGFLSFAERIG